MASLRTLYQNFKNDCGDLLQVTDFSIATWLAFGASLQLLSQSWLSPQLSYLIPLVYLVYRVARVSVDCRRIFTGTFTNLNGRTMVSYAAGARGSVNSHCYFGRCSHILIGGLYQPVRIVNHATKSFSILARVR